MKKNPIEYILQNRVLTHVLLWLSILVIYPIYASSFNQSFLAAIIVKAFMLPVQIAATYWLIYYQFPKFLYQKKYLRFGVSLFLSALVFCTLHHLIQDFLMVKVLKGYSHAPHTFFEIIANPFANIGYTGADVYLTVFIVAAMKIIKQRLEEKSQIDVLETEKAKAELKLLKAQINPRILSKTLHQLHTLTLQKSDTAPEVVIKLSDMLDYMLYQVNTPKVLINKEIELVQNYLDLEKLRYGAAINIIFYHDLENNFSEISSLLLLSLVESAFLQKETDLPQNATVEILLKENNNQLNIKIFSNLVDLEPMNEANFRKQLEALYPNQYTLELATKNESYYLNLDLSLVDLATA